VRKIKRTERYFAAAAISWKSVL